MKLKRWGSNAMFATEQVGNKEYARNAKEMVICQRKPMNRIFIDKNHKLLNRGDTIILSDNSKAVVADFNNGGRLEINHPIYGGLQPINSPTDWGNWWLYDCVKVIKED